MQERSKGIILFAFNTDKVNYVEIAENATRLIHKTLDLPVTLVTDTPVTSNLFDTVQVIENNLINSRSGYNEGTQWRNGGRYRAYELSPYDTTLLIDSDFLMLDTNLLKVFDTVNDYYIFYNNNTRPIEEAVNMGPNSLPFVWATGVIFNKCETSEMLFDLVGRIQRNYNYYHSLYNMYGGNFRNDYAFAIANYMLNGYSINNKNNMPWALNTVNDEIIDIELTNDQLIIRSKDKAFISPKQNLHVISKDYLTGDNFKKLVNELCQ